MTENQKLREVLQHAIEDLSSATGFLTRRSRDRQSKTVAALAKLQAGEMVNGLTKAETDASASVSGLTAAPVGEREAFEREMSKPPFEFCMDRWPDDGSYAWPGNYAAYHTQCAWVAWQARAALAGDAADAQRLDFLDALCSRPASSDMHMRNGSVALYVRTGIGAQLAAQGQGKVRDAIDAAMRKDKT